MKIELLSSVERQNEITTSSLQLVDIGLKSKVKISFDFADPSVLQDSTFTFRLIVEDSNDGVKWIKHYGVTFVGLAGSVWKERPSMQFPLTKVSGKYIRAKIDTNKSVQYSLELEDVD